MYSSISKDVMNQVTSSETSCDSWKALQHLYASPSESRIFQLEILLHNSKKGDSTMADFFTCVKKLADQLGTAGHSVLKNVHIRVFLIGVNNEYDISILYNKKEFD